MAVQDIQLVDAGQEARSYGEKIYSRFVKSYLGYVDNAIRKHVKHKADETIAQDYPHLRVFEENWQVMRSELEALLENQSSIVLYEDVDKRYQRSDGNTKTQQKSSWKIEQFFLYGNSITRGLKRSPKTAEILKKVPETQTALFSILQPGTHIKTHRGEYAGMLRYHLGLKVDTPEACKIRVEDRTYHWEEGQAFIFDHTDEHEAWNGSESIRVILIVDFIRKLPLHLNVLNRFGLKLLKRSQHIKEAVHTLEIGC